jgi:hypothetical protein
VGGRPHGALRNGILPGQAFGVIANRAIARLRRADEMAAAVRIFALRGDAIVLFGPDGSQPELALEWHSGSPRSGDGDSPTALAVLQGPNGHHKAHEIAELKESEEA